MNQNNAAQPVLTDLELLDVGAKHGRPSVSLLPMWRAIETAVLSKLRAPVADERAVAYLHTSNRTLTWPGKLNEVQLASGVWRALYEHPPAPGHKPAPMDVSPGHSSPVAGEAVAWVAADTLNSPHPTCISSLAYMSQIDRERGREYVPLTIIDRYAAPSSAQPAVNGYTCTVPDDCETLHWRGQILSMNELASVAQPGVGEEIHVHIEGQDVLTLPLASSGMDAPRFVVHLPAQAQQPVSGADGLPDSVIEAIARAHGTGGWQSLSDMVRFGRALLTHLSAQPHPTQNNDGGAG